MTHRTEDIYLRQMGIVHPELLSLPIVVIGAGNIGSWTVYNLLKIGCTNVTVYDGDTVELHNTSSQIYTESQLERMKVHALRDTLAPLVQVAPTVEAINIQMDELRNYKIVIGAVDNMTTRSSVFEALQGQDIIYIDGRLGGHTAQVYSTRMNQSEDIELYRMSLFPDSEADPIPCSMRSIAYNSLIIAGLITSTVVKAVNNRAFYRRIEVDMENYTMTGGLSKHSTAVTSNWTALRGVGIVGANAPQNPATVSSEQQPQDANNAPRID